MNKSFIFSLLCVSYLLTSFSSVLSCTNCTRVERSIGTVLNRKKRFLIYPPLSNVVVTASIVKALIITAPKGYNLLGEIDFFYPLPSQPRYPPKKHKVHKLPPPPPPAPAPTPPPLPPPPPLQSPPWWSTMKSDSPPIKYDHNDNHISSWTNNHPGEVYVKPPTALQSTPYNRRKYWEDQILTNENFSLRRPSKYQPSYPVPPLVPVKRLYLKPLKFPQINKSYKKSTWHPPTTLYQSRPVGYASNYYLPRGRSLHLDKINSTENNNNVKIKRSLNDIDDHQDWENYHAHKDRQDLYKNFEKVFKLKGFDIQPCISRAICEAQHFLLPPGKSLFQDLFRIFFSIPVRDEIHDDYSTAMRTNDKHDCWRRYEKNCPISILEAFFKTVIYN